MKERSERLEVFLLTYNRAVFLAQTLESLCRQSVGRFPITVLDNGSTDNTPQVVENFKDFGVQLKKNDKNVSIVENFRRAQELAQREWVMVFHDDDLLHPDYLNTALALTEKYPDAALVGSGMSFEERPSAESWPHCKGDHICCPKAQDFAALLYEGFPFHFGSTLYRTEFFKTTPVRYEVYGKVADRPFLLDIAGHGSVIVLKEPYVKYRCHSGQDSADNFSGPFIEQLFALHKAYLQLLGTDSQTHYGRIFIQHNYKYLVDEHSHLRDSEMTLEEYLNMAVMTGASTQEAIDTARN